MKKRVTAEELGATLALLFFKTQEARESLWEILAGETEEARTQALMELYPVAVLAIEGAAGQALDNKDVRDAVLGEFYGNIKHMAALSPAMIELCDNVMGRCADYQAAVDASGRTDLEEAVGRAVSDLWGRACGRDGSPAVASIGAQFFSRMFDDVYALLKTYKNDLLINAPPPEP